MAQPNNGEINLIDFEANVSMANVSQAQVAKARQRQQLIDNLSATVKSPELLLPLSVPQIEVKLSMLERHCDTFENLQSSLELLDVTEFDNSFRVTFETLYYHAKVMLKERLAQLQSHQTDITLSSTRVPSMPLPSRRVQLPSIQLTTFNGSESDWLDFYNVFTVLVHANDDLSNIEKFQYLRSCLTDNAARLIQALEVASSNYVKAVELLRGRYENKRFIFMSHLQAIFDAQKITKSNASSIRELIDAINVNLRAMQSIASAQQVADGILLHLVSSKLDANTQAKWEEEVSSAFDSGAELILPSWNDLAKFLERRCKTLSMMDSTQPAANSSQGRTNTSRGLIRSSLVTSTPAVNQKCALCETTPTHNAFKCEKFTTMSTTQRFDLVKRLNLCINCLGTGHRCRECPSSHRCQHCGVGHHTLLHNGSTTTAVERTADNPERAVLLSSSTALQVSYKHHEILLGTALINVSNSHGVSTQSRALLDSASQLNFVTERLAQRIHLSRKKANFNISGIGMKTTQSCQIGSLNIMSKDGNFCATIDVVIIPTITINQPQRQLDTTSWMIPDNCMLADDTFHLPGQIDVLIGAGLFYNLMLNGKIQLNGPTLQNTQLGWIVVGETSMVTVSQNHSVQSLHSAAPYKVFTTPSTNPTIEQLVERFWTIEDNVAPAAVPSVEEFECETYFRQTVRSCNKSGKYIVRLPLKEELSSLGDSYQIARKRMRSLESKFVHNPSLQNDYIAFIDEYIKMGHMTHVPEEEASSTKLNYIPHHCVLKLDSSTTKLRVVFDASCRTSNDKSLNDILKVGPTIQDDLFTILLRFRKHRFVIMADIAKMYRQIFVEPDDTKYQCILWRPTQTEPMATYRLQTVTYGTSCAPYLATKCLQQIARDYVNQYPIGALVTESDFYVDNLLTGGSSIEEVIKIKSEVTTLLNLGGFPLRKFAANDPTIIADVAECDREEIIRFHNTDCVKTLGLKWSPQEDIFMFGIHRSTKSPITKRNILSQIAMIFDPLGLLNPLVVTCKILLQNLWKISLQWDDPVPREVQHQWHKIQREFSELQHLMIPSVEPSNIFHWSDSTITLAWIARDPSRWNVFVSNRVNEIQQHTIGSKWLHVPTSENPADFVSRGATVKDLTKNSLWLNGPQYLLLEEQHWPPTPLISDNEIPEVRNQRVSLVIQQTIDLLEDHKFLNNYTTILRMFAYVNRFIERARKNESPHITLKISSEEMEIALRTICKHIQQFSFTKEYKTIAANQSIHQESPLLQLSPFMHDGLIRVGGRINKSDLPFDSKHPILLPGNHPFVRTLIDYHHKHHLHAGAQTLHNILRGKFWITNARNTIRQVTRNCIICYKCRPILAEQLLGNLPMERVTAAHPFEKFGVDYCGPFLYTQRIRRKGPLKVYVAIFMCFVTKAVHMEVVHDLTTGAFIAALKRFIARRGKCHTIFSDNATNFVGANRELRELLQTFLTQHHIDLVSSACREEGIEWKFIPPRSPHFGGLWENAVKQAKYYFRRTIGNHILTHDELITLCCQVEAMVNSRPLTPLSSDPHDLSPLTPAHFLIGRALTTIPEPTEIQHNLLRKYQLIHRLQQQFWDRWHSDYLNQLQLRSKWKMEFPNIQVNDMVIIKEDNTPPLKWPMGRVVNIVPGEDGKVRVVTIQTTNGIVKRAIARICKLPIEATTSPSSSLS